MNNRKTMTQQEKREAIVVGAGPVGMVAALALRHEGLKATIVEAEEEGRFRQGSRAIYIHKATLKLLEEVSPGLGLNFAVLDMPGHAPDHILLYDPKRKWAIVGDLVIEHMSTNAIIEPDASGRLIPTVTQQLESLKRCLTLDVNLLFTAHGRVVHTPKAIIEDKISRIEHKLERVMNLIRAGNDTAGGIARLFYKDIFEKQYFWVMSEVIGLLAHLERSGYVVSRKTDGIYHYTIMRRDSNDSS